MSKRIAKQYFNIFNGMKSKIHATILIVNWLKDKNFNYVLLELDFNFKIYVFE